MRWALALLLLVFAGCSDRAVEHADHHHDEEAAHPEAAAAEGGDDLLRIDPEMLRDLRITVSPVESRPGSEGVTALGELGVDEDHYAEVGSPVSARVTAVLAGIGERVEPDAPLVELESVEVGKLRAELATASARAELARQALARKRRLAEERIVPRREVQEAEAAAAAAEAELRSARAVVGTLGAPTGDDAARFQLRSPLAGIVIDRDVARGQMAEPTRPLFRVADLGRLWLTVHAFERDAVRVAPGAQARVALAALPGRSFQGRVALVGRRVDPDSRTLAVRIDLANDEGILRPGMSANAWLPLGEDAATVVAVPAAALQRLHAGWCAFLPRGEGVFEVRAVGRGRDLGGEVEIVHGLEAGERVVVEGAFLLKAEADKSRGEGEHHDH